MMAALMLKLDCAGLFVDYGGKPRFRVAVVVFWPWGSPVSVRSLAEIFRMLMPALTRAHQLFQYLPDRLDRLAPCRGHAQDVTLRRSYTRYASLGSRTY